MLQCLHFTLSYRLLWFIICLAITMCLSFLVFWVDCCAAGWCLFGCGGRRFGFL